MRKLVVLMQTSADGFVGADRPVSWQLWNYVENWPWDAALRREFNDTLAAVDTILLSRLMVEDYVAHWTGIAELYPALPDFAFARHIVEAEKIVLTDTSFVPRAERTRAIRGALPETMRALKRGPGRDIITFGGVRLVSELLAEGLVDELQLYANPAALGGGQTIFYDGARQLTLLGSQSYDCGIVVNRYAPGELL
ncbi:dihydrofolate reductase family protein [Devosia sp. XK-2]|uniref:dihydrofolate reductase family protein n=1 Tax=Devosia sp. XK-2 TaxID=3126689 RepID=UPI0030CC65BA